MSKSSNRAKIIKRVEILDEALQTALEAILEIQSEQRLIRYLLSEEEKEDEKD